MYILVRVGIVGFILGLAVSASADDPPNAPAKYRETVAALIQGKLSRELNGKKFKSNFAREKIEVGFIETIATGKAVAEFIDPLKELHLEVPTLHHHGADGIRMTATMNAPVKVHADGAAAPFQLGLDVTGTVEIMIEADVKLTVTGAGKIKADITIRKWDGGLSDIDLGNGEANKLLGPILQQAAKKAIQDNRQKLQNDANLALKKAFEEGRLQFDF